MAYTKTVYATGDIITAVKLNNAEDGIEDVDTELTAHVAIVAHVAGTIYAYKNIGGSL